MGIKLGDNINITAGLPNDCRYQNAAVGPYTGVSEANTVVTSDIRYVGLTLNINNSEYWYKDGVTDIDLVEKTTGSGGGSGLLNWTGSTSNAIGTYISVSGICAQPNLTFDGSVLSVSGTISGTTVCGTIICGTNVCSTNISGTTICGTNVCSTIICATTCGRFSNTTGGHALVVCGDRFSNNNISAIYARMDNGVGGIKSAGLFYGHSSVASRTSGRSNGITATAGDRTDKYNHGVITQLCGVSEGTALTAAVGTFSGAAPAGCWAGYFIGNTYTAGVVCSTVCFKGDGSGLTNIPSSGGYWTQTGTSIYYGDGNVLIGGTGTPERELEVKGVGNVYIRVTAPTATDSTAIELKNTLETWTIRNDDTLSNSLLFQNVTGTALTIGTDNKSYMTNNLSVTGNIKSRDYVEVLDTGGAEGFKMQWNDTEKSIDFIIN